MRSPMRNGSPRPTAILPGESFDENTAAGMCYTSGTTGNPKGVVYSHRSNVLHAMWRARPTRSGHCSLDVVMPVVPMFHANGWSLAFSAPDGRRHPGTAGHEAGWRLDLRAAERATRSLARRRCRPCGLTYCSISKRAAVRCRICERVVIGGSACPRAIVKKFQERYGVEVIHAWGMTEMCAARDGGHAEAGLRRAYRAMRGSTFSPKQGHAPFWSR